VPAPLHPRTNQASQCTNLAVRSTGVCMQLDCMVVLSCSGGHPGLCIWLGHSSSSSGATSSRHRVTASSVTWVLLQLLRQCHQHMHHLIAPASCCLVPASDDKGSRMRCCCSMAREVCNSR
jgi:hypothetical protein